MFIAYRPVFEDYDFMRPEVMDNQIDVVARKVPPMIQSRRPAGGPDGYQSQLCTEVDPACGIF